MRKRKLEGGCFCGRVRYRLTAPPMFVHCCHCTDCQNQTGSAFVINALIETDRIELLGGSLERIHIFTRSKQPWVELPPEVPAFKVYYDTQQLWPKKSLERRNAVL